MPRALLCNAGSSAIGALLISGLRTPLLLPLVAPGLIPWRDPCDAFYVARPAFDVVRFQPPALSLSLSLCVCVCPDCTALCATPVKTEGDKDWQVPFEAREIRYELLTLTQTIPDPKMQDGRGRKRPISTCVPCYTRKQKVCVSLVIPICPSIPSSAPADESSS